MTTEELLHQMSSVGSPIASMVLSHGMAFPSVREPSSLGPHRQCFHNAAKRVMRNIRFTYVEGFAKAIIPCHHAWMVDEDGRVLDPTWGESGSDYFGVPIKRDYLREQWLKRDGLFQGVIDNWRENFPLRRLPVEEWIETKFTASIKHQNV